MTDVTKALSVVQPWIWAMMHAGKFVENRSWKPHAAITGKRIALHASKGWDADASRFIHELSGKIVPHEDDPVMGRGCIVATAVVRAVFSADDLEDFTHSEQTLAGVVENSRWYTGDVAWVLVDILPLAPHIEARGALGLWTLPAPLKVLP